MKCIIGRILIILGTLGSAYMFYYMMNDTISNYVSPFSKREVVFVLSFITILVLFFAGLFITLSYAAQKDEKPTYNVRIKDRETIKIDNKDDKSSFRGDLSMCADDRYKMISSDTNSQFYEDFNTDSSDAVIFLSFTNVHRVGWVCSECGTVNSNEASNCAVCGLRK